MIHEHSAQILNTRLLTTDQWGDYLIYLNPQQKVYVDGRSDFYGQEIGNEYLRVDGRPVGLGANHEKERIYERAAAVGTADLPAVEARSGVEGGSRTVVRRFS